MKFLTQLLRIDQTPGFSAKYSLMLTQNPDSGHMEARGFVEGFHMGYGSSDALMGASKQAKLAEDSINLLRDALKRNSCLEYVGVLTLNAHQLHLLGFETLAKLLDARRP
jgi:hypothetical protein